MADGLLRTRGERLRDFWLKFAYGLGPTAVLALAALALGGGAVAWSIAVVGVLLGFMVATTARKPRGALMGGVAIAVLLFVFQLVLAWLITHPIEKG